MRQTIRATLVTLALVAATASITRAQTHRFHIGPHVGYNFDVEEFFIGAQFSVPIAYRAEFYPSFDYYFVGDEGSLWAVNADLKWRVAHDRPNWLYIGAGLNVSRFDNGEDDTNLGLNLLAGVEPLRGRIHPFAEGKLIISDNTGFQLQAGLNITIGR